MDYTVSHRNGFRAEYPGRNLAEYSAETVSVKIMGFGYRIFDPLAHIWMSQESMSFHIFGNFSEYSATNKQLLNVQFRPNIRWFLVTEGSVSAKTRKSCFGDSLGVQSISFDAVGIFVFHL